MWIFENIQAWSSKLDSTNFLEKNTLYVNENINYILFVIDGQE